MQYLLLDDFPNMLLEIWKTEELYTDQETQVSVNKIYCNISEQNPLLLLQKITS